MRVVLRSEMQKARAPSDDKVLLCLVFEILGMPCLVVLLAGCNANLQHTPCESVKCTALGTVCLLALPKAMSESNLILFSTVLIDML
jgi:hypothetical protein